jgi:hypothetical protein
MSRQKFPTEVRAIAASEWIESRGYNAQPIENGTVVLTDAPSFLINQARAAFDR